MNARSRFANWIGLILVASPIFAQQPESLAFASTIANKTPPAGPPPEGMVWIPGGEFSMGSDGKSNGELCCSPTTVAAALDCEPAPLPVSVMLLLDWLPFDV